MPENKLPWFRCFHSKFLGALAQMRPLEGYVYVIVCFRIYEVGGPCPDTLEALTRRVGSNRRHVSDALDSLFRSKKLVRTADGIMNPFAAEILAEAQAFHDERSNAGAKGAEQRWKKDKQNQQSDDSSATLLPIANDSHLHLQEHKQRKKGGRARASRQPMREDWQPTEQGVEFARACGFSDSKIGKMTVACRDYHLKHGTLIAGDVGLAATWRTWCNNEVKFAKERPNGQGRSRSLSQAQRGLTTEEILELAEQARDLERRAVDRGSAESVREH